MILRALIGLHASARRAALALLIGVAVAACTDYTRDLPPVPPVEMKGFEPSVKNALEKARAQFEAIAAKRPDRERLGEAYGELAMMYHAQDLVAPAAVAYANAHRLAPDDKRWPYLLGHLYNDAARVPEAIASFEEVLAKHPADAPTLLALGQAYLQSGAFDKAAAIYERLKALPSAEPAGKRCRTPVASYTPKPLRSAVALPTLTSSTNSPAVALPGSLAQISLRMSFGSAVARA